MNKESSSCKSLLKKRRGRPSLFLDVWKEPELSTKQSLNEPIPNQRVFSPLSPLHISCGLPTTPNLIGNKRKSQRSSQSGCSSANKVGGESWAKRRKLSRDEYAMRKFYEAGGRDYKQFLQWKEENSEALEMGLSASAKDVPLLTVPSLNVPSELSQNQPSLTARDDCSTSSDTQKSPVFNICTPESPVSSTSNGSGDEKIAEAQQVPSSSADLVRAQYLLALQAAIANRLQNSPSLDLLPPVAPFFPWNAWSLIAAAATASSPVATATLSPTSNSNCNPTATVPQLSPGATDLSNNLPICQWDTKRVQMFVHSVPGCEVYAPLFAEHFIDGNALIKLSEQHLRNVFNMKLGPVIRLKDAITKLIQRQQDSLTSGANDINVES